MYAQVWNRSSVLVPEGAPVGAAVLLHGLTDSPYSLRHIARRYRAHGYVSVAIRLAGHGTVPAGLAKVERSEVRRVGKEGVRKWRLRWTPYTKKQNNYL